MRSQAGFTLIEILMVVLLVSILAAVSIPQFIDFRTEAKDASTQAAVGTLRSAIANQYANITVRCGANPGTFPTVANLNANDVTSGAGAPCTTAQVTVTTDRQFVAGTGIPDNPWSGGTPKNTVVACTGDGCDPANEKACDGEDFVAASSGWCYNPANGGIWANSNLSPNKEFSF
jgi:prepilin-type N-terminal cleavage/methylation domain-containing protein